MNLVITEMRRALSRRSIRVLIVIGLLGCVMAGVVSYFGSAGKSIAQLRLDDDGHPAIMTEWWVAADNEGFLIVATFFLIIGGFFGGATLAGGEWRAGTITTMLTWEPRRLWLHTARNISAGLLSFVISFVLQILFAASFLPSVFLNGTTDGVTPMFWVDLGILMGRTSAIVAAGTLLAIALATIARNTAFAVIVAFAWVVVLEQLLRGLRPSWAPWLWAENLGTVISWGQIPDADFTRSPLAALATLGFYCASIAVVAALSFQRRDVVMGT